MEKNEKFVCKILNYGANGEGVGVSPDGKVAFVPYALQGEEVVANTQCVKKSYVECSLNSINKTSEFRTNAKCPYYEICGGCQLQHIEYNEALKIKQQIIQNAIDKIAKIDAMVLPCISSNLSYGYRNKISAPFDCVSRKICMHDTNNNLLPINDCIITQSWCKKLIEITNEFVKKYGVSIYNPKTNKGLLKQIVARKVGASLLVTLVLTKNKLPNYEDYFTALLTEFEAVGLGIINNAKASNYLPIGKYTHLCGLEEIELVEFGVRYTINNECFMQVNTYIKNLIYEQVVEECKGFDLAIDAYSGAGLLTALISKCVKNAIGVEIVDEATKSADKLCKENNILNVQNICGDSAKVINDLKQKIKENKTVVVLDPPRKGCAINLLNTLNEVAPLKILYVSCDPSTLARDLNILCAQKNSKYKISYIRPYDMFPQTKHVETVVMLTLK